MTDRFRPHRLTALWPTTQPAPVDGSLWVAAALRVALAARTAGPGQAATEASLGMAGPSGVEGPTPPPVPSPQQWPQILAAIRRHRVVPLVGAAADTLGLSDDQRDDLHAAHLTAAGLALMVVASTRQVAAALDNAGIRALFIKGPVLALGQHRAVTDRGGGDVDVWVHPDDVARAADVVGTAGWQVASSQVGIGNGWRQRLARRVVQEMTLVQHDRPPIDLHWRITRIPGQIALTFDEAWQRSMPVVEPLGGVRTLGPVDTLVHLCTHATSDAFATLNQVFDVASQVHAMAPGVVVEAARTNPSVAIAVSVAANLDPRVGVLVPNRRRVKRLARWGWNEALASRLRQVDRLDTAGDGVGGLRVTLLVWQVATSRTPMAAAGVLADPVVVRTVVR